MRFDTIWLDARLATLALGRPGRGIVTWDVERPAELVYRMGFNSLYARIRRGG